MKFGVSLNKVLADMVMGYVLSTRDWHLRTPFGAFRSKKGTLIVF
jgi:hypothetical protein